MSLIPQNVVLDDVTWVNTKGVASTLNARAGLGSDGFPDDVSVDVVKGQYQGTKLRAGPLPRGLGRGGQSGRRHHQGPDPADCPPPRRARPLA
jgi:hypothetical protein